MTHPVIFVFLWKKIILGWRWKIIHYTEFWTLLILTSPLSISLGSTSLVLYYPASHLHFSYDFPSSWTYEELFLWSLVSRDSPITLAHPLSSSVIFPTDDSNPLGHRSSWGLRTIQEENLKFKFHAHACAHTHYDTPIFRPSVGTESADSNLH